jgi:hypothetical protein
MTVVRDACITLSSQISNASLFYLPNSRGPLPFHRTVEKGIIKMLSIIKQVVKVSTSQRRRLKYTSYKFETDDDDATIDKDLGQRVSFKHRSACLGVRLG